MTRLRTDRWIKRTTICCVGMLALIAGTVSYLHMHRASRLTVHTAGDSTASAAARGPDHHADMEGNRTLNL